MRSTYGVRRARLGTLVVCGVAVASLFPTPTARAQEPAAANAANATKATKATTVRLDLLPCIGKGIPEYAKVLGKPAKVTPQTQSHFQGEERVYASPELRTRGVARIDLATYDWWEAHPGAVTRVRVAFLPSAGVGTWQEALDFLGIPRDGVLARPFGARTLLEGVSRDGVPMSPVIDGDFDDDGFGITWRASDPDASGNPTLEVRYHFGRFVPVQVEPWQSHAVEGAQGRMEILPDGTMKLTTTRIGQNPWSSAAWVTSRAVSDGNTFVLTFEAKADEARDLWVVSELDQKPWTVVGLNAKNVAVGTDWRRCELSFRAKGVGEDSGKPVRLPNFFGGDRLGSIYVRNLRVRVKTAGF